MTFVAVIDRSGSMAGASLAAAKRAVRGVVRHLRRGDFFGLAVFDIEAQVLVPLSAESDDAALNLVIEGIEAGDSTNLAGGWCLGRDLLADAPTGCPRKLLLLTDGQLNTGGTEPAIVTRMAAGGLERNFISTSCLGFGPGYNEDLLEAVAKATGGALHNTNQPDQLPEVFRKELDGLQSLVVQNLRLRARSCGFVERIAVLGDYVETVPPLGGKEVSVGGLVSGEQRVVVLALEELPIPTGADGHVVANWDGEDLLELEIRYDAITTGAQVSRSETYRVRVRPEQSPDEVRVNEEVLPWVTLQAVEKAVLGLMKKVVALGGTISGEHGIGLAKTPFLRLQRSDAEIGAMRAVRHALDPEGILHPGKMLEVFEVWKAPRVVVAFPWDHK